jgi:hypothetical protein
MCGDTGDGARSKSSKGDKGVHRAKKRSDLVEGKSDWQPLGESLG